MITTKKGDGGTTSLYDGTRVSKDDARIELNGELDELNALLGLCKAVTQQAEPFEQKQKELMTVMSVVANGYQSRPGKDALSEALDTLLMAINEMEDDIKRETYGKKFNFVLPGGDMADAALHLARTKARTCERRLVTLSNIENVDEQQYQWSVLKKYLNRLSDYLYCLSIR
ncbi:ATP:cob(I)alamin adenosyltransferase [Bacteroidales bacterium KA00344]|nr:ATP:cob(I)alamin adenosyltransferase [Bacteroidales bacterium KA00344]